MNTKRLITASIFSLISASTALAADVMIPHQPASSTASTIVAPTFSWTGLYLGVQAGGFSSKADMALVGQEKSLPLDKEFSPKLSGFVGGFYAGSNIDLGDNFIFGIDTDLMISGKKHTKTITIGAADNTTVENAVVRSRRSAKPQTSPTSQATALTGVQTQKDTSRTPAGTGTTTGGTPTAGSTSEKSVATQSSQALTKSVNTVQQPQTGATQSNKVATTRSSGNVNSTVEKTVVVGRGNSGVSTPSLKTPSASPIPQSASSKQTVSSVQSPSSSLERSGTGPTSVSGVNGLKSPAPKSISSTTGVSSPEQSTLLLARSDTGDQPSVGGTNGVTASAKSAETSSVSAGAVQVQATPTKSVAVKPAPSISSTGTEASQPAAKAPASEQSSLKERTVPSGGTFVLARSGSSSETAKASNGTSGAQQGGHHGAHGSGNANPHGASHAGGHGSGANPHASRSHGGQNMAGHGAQSTQAVDKNNSSVYGIEQIKKMASELGLGQEDEAETLNHTFKQNWGGATRVRIGFAADRFMPYLAGGIAYGQFQDTVSISVKDEDGRVVSSKNLADETKTMIGYTLGGGVDFSLLDNVIVRAEYRYSDFGKKKFAKEKLEVNYKTNDFRVGVAYKF
ncbi:MULTISPECIES: outer membrane beta-barrel protein [unclassified Bartonella]|uniref:outer membrane beta-barrel protein n=1 Tax=unclassified Bartonella TaxID=2645622 RepID=UPI0035D09789